MCDAGSKKFLHILRKKARNNLSSLIVSVCGSGNETLPVFVWFSARLARRDIYM
jgi:hypothetical protein